MSWVTISCRSPTSLDRSSLALPALASPARGRIHHSSSTQATIAAAVIAPRVGSASGRVSARAIGETMATSLPTTMPGDDRLFDFEKLINALAESSPSIVDTSVSKIRSQFAFENGWFELADVDFEQCSTQSVSVNSRDLEVVKEVTKQLETGKLEVMNYVEACRRWG